MASPWDSISYITLHYTTLHYKYMTTVPKVNNKDWRISMNSTYAARVCTSPLKRAEFSSSAIGFGKFQQISIYCCLKGYSGTLEPENTCCWRQTVILEVDVVITARVWQIIVMLSESTTSSMIGCIVKSLIFNTSENNSSFLRISCISDTCKNRNSITPRQGMRC